MRCQTSISAKQNPSIYLAGRDSKRAFDSVEIRAVLEQLVHNAYMNTLANIYAESTTEQKHFIREVGLATRQNLGNIYRMLNKSI